MAYPVCWLTNCLHLRGLPPVKLPLLVNGREAGIITYPDCSKGYYCKACGMDSEGTLIQALEIKALFRLSSKVLNE